MLLVSIKTVRGCPYTNNQNLTNFHISHFIFNLVVSRQNYIILSYHSNQSRSQEFERGAGEILDKCADKMLAVYRQILKKNQM